MRLLFPLLASLSICAQADSTSDESLAEAPSAADETVEPAAGAPTNPALTLTTADLSEYNQLSPERQQLVRRALELVHEHGGLPYTYGGESAAEGGFDCSGFIYCLLTTLAEDPLQPPRSSAAQFGWLKRAETIHKAPGPIHDLDDEFFDQLQPGDLLFWAGTYDPTRERENDITHVALYLGHERKGNLAVMINSSSGRSYRGQRQEGLTVVDFYLPREGSSRTFRGYGPVPELEGEE